MLTFNQLHTFVRTGLICEAVDTRRRCSVNDCGRLHRSRGLCDAHRWRQEHGVPLDRSMRTRKADPLPLGRCKSLNCRNKAHGARGYCTTHYQLIRADERGEVCSVPGCGRLSITGGLCKLHKYRKQVGADPLTPPRRVKRGFYTRCDGYRVITVPTGTPGAREKNGRAEMLEHRYVMQTCLGRPLLSNETVHHKNGDRGDNSQINLELKSGPHARGVSAPDAVNDALCTLRRYAKLTRKEETDLLRRVKIALQFTLELVGDPT